MQQQQGAMRPPPQEDGGYYSYYPGAEEPSQGWARYSQPVLHLHQPVYSQHHANLDGAVDSSRWTAMYGDGSAVMSIAAGGTAAGDNAGVRAPLQQALRESNGATVGEMMSYVPPLQQSPPAGQSRRLYDDNESGATPIGIPTKPFIAKLIHLVDNPAEFRDCITWDSTGRSFIICHSSVRLVQEVLPRYFSHSNIHSFTRQLNVYGFARANQVDLAEKLATTEISNFSCWTHPFFVRHDRSMIHTLTPKPSRARMQKKIEKQHRLEAEDQARREANYRKLDMDGSGTSASGSSRSVSQSAGDWGAYNAP